MNEIYIGLMSGTSLDGIDGVLVDFGTVAHPSMRVLAHTHRPFDSTLVRELLALNTPGENELHRAALAGNAIARAYATVIDDLLDATRMGPDQVLAIGAHGQTVRHRPREFDGNGYTLQLLNASLLAELCGIDVVADLRSRDLAAGGQGAPLVPAFHRAVFGAADQASAVLNIGGISNLTSLHADGSTTGMDCGPGNALLDYWCQLHTGRAFDDAGAWAATGQVVQPLLMRLLDDPYFAKPLPKSTGRDLFNPSWLHDHLTATSLPGTMPPQDVQATLTELTAIACARDIERHAPAAGELLVCGGGAFNTHLMRRIAHHLSGIAVRSTSERGLPPSQVEATAFAWLARAFRRRECASLPAVTGASGPRVLGALYPSR